MLKICEIDDINSYYFTDDPDIIVSLQQNGIRPYCKDFDNVFYFKKKNKLFKVLDKLGIEY